MNASDLDDGLMSVGDNDDFASNPLDLPEAKQITIKEHNPSAFAIPPAASPTKDYEKGAGKRRSKNHRRRLPSLEMGDEINLDASFEVSDLGTFKIPGFEINFQGFRQTNDGNYDHNSTDIQTIHEEQKYPSGIPFSPPTAPTYAPSLSNNPDNASSNTNNNDFDHAPRGAINIPSSHPHPYANSASLPQSSSLVPPLSSSPPMFSLPESILRESFIESPLQLVRLSEIGRGACGTVFRAIHMPTLRMVAMKQVSVFDKAKRHQLVKELTALSSYSNIPQLIGLHGAFYDQGCVFLALEYMNRTSLQEVLKVNGPLKEPILRHVANQVLLALVSLHSKHVVHRDIKPSNILVNHQGVIKLADFGVLTMLQHTHDMASTYVGTTMYMSPERIEGAYASPADIWSLGVTLLALATGQPPYESNEGYFGIVRKITRDPPPEVPSNLFSPHFCSFIRACLVKDPAKRWTATQLLDHSFIKEPPSGASIDPLAPEQLPFFKPTEHDHQDLLQVVTLLIEKLYVQPNQAYKRSLFELARFQRIGDELGFPCQHVQQVFESRYMQMQQQLQQQQFQQQQQQFLQQQAQQPRQEPKPEANILGRSSAPIPIPMRTTSPMKPATAPVAPLVQPRSLPPQQQFQQQSQQAALIQPIVQRGFQPSQQQQTYHRQPQPLAQQSSGKSALSFGQPHPYNTRYARSQRKCD